MLTVIQESAERILGKYLEAVNENEITDIVYAMGNAIAEKMEIKKKKEPRRSRPGNGDRRERKMKAEMKQSRQKIARVSNELHKRKQKRKAIRKEKMILKMPMKRKEVASKFLWPMEPPSEPTCF